MLPEQLEKFFEENYEDDYSIFLSSVSRMDRGLELEIEIRIHDAAEEHDSLQRWTIKAPEHRKSRFSLGYATSLSLTMDDPLLWEFTDVQSELYFNEQIKDAAKLFHELYLTHKKLFGNDQSFNVVFAEMSSTFDHLKYSNGLVAKGSRNLLQHYAVCLERQGIGYAIVGERHSTYWDGARHMPEKDSLKLLTLGDSFIIAEDFIFTLQGNVPR